MPASEHTELSTRLRESILDPLKSMFVGKDEIIDLMGICLTAGENLFLLGPPGTAKSALVQSLARQFDGSMFDYLLTRFTEPNELFGPFDIRRLREGELLTNTEGMLPEANLVFLDELLNANSAILNSLLMVLNERVFRRGRETRKLPTLMFVGASNRLPEDDALNALFDRFLLRVNCPNVEIEELQDVLLAGWNLEKESAASSKLISADDIRRLQTAVLDIDLSNLQQRYVDVIQRLRHAGIKVSDRRAVKLQRVIAASALMCGRDQALPSDLWVLRYIWDNEEQQEILSSIVNDVADHGDQQAHHPRSKGDTAPDPEQLARDLDRLEQRIKDATKESPDTNYHKDQLTLLSSRCQWVEANQQREFLEKRIEGIWNQLP
jgi:MoxR-like ATPase